MERILISETNTVEWLGLRDNVDESYINDATVRMTLKDSAGAVISGANALSLAYVLSSNGDYRGTIGAGATSGLTDGTTYYLEVTATAAAGTGFRRIAVLAVYHGAQ